MTAFLIVLIIFLIAGIADSNKKKNKFSEIKRLNTSNIPVQYKIACDIIEPMAKMYREKLAKLNIAKNIDYYSCSDRTPFGLDNYVSDSEVLKSPYDFARERLELCKDKSYKVSQRLAHSYGAHEFLYNYFVGAALGLCTYDDSYSENTICKVYADNLWDFIPDVCNQQFVDDFKAKFNLQHMDNTYLFNVLDTAIFYKNRILFASEEGSYYSYDDAKIIEKIASEFGLPTNSELKTMSSNEYCWNIPQLAIFYSKYKIQEMGYSGDTHLKYIRTTPTDEEKEIILGHGGTTYEINNKFLDKQEALRKKYPYVNNINKKK